MSEYDTNNTNTVIGRCTSHVMEAYTMTRKCKLATRMRKHSPLCLGSVFPLQLSLLSQQGRQVLSNPTHLAIALNTMFNWHWQQTHLLQTFDMEVYYTS